MTNLAEYKITTEIECYHCDGTGKTDEFDNNCGRAPSDCCGGCTIVHECIVCEGHRSIDLTAFEKDEHEELATTILLLDSLTFLLQAEQYVIDNTLQFISDNELDLEKVYKGTNLYKLSIENIKYYKDQIQEARYLISEYILESKIQ